MFLLLLQDMLKRPVGPPRKFINPISDPEGAFGFGHWGFTKANELFAGRVAMLVSTRCRRKLWQKFFLPVTGASAGAGALA
jgi:hypothetical protein